MRLKILKFSLKKAFTLAEILIVLTIIGVLALMTIPSVVQHSLSAQKIAKFKKAFNAISNAYAKEFALKSAPAKANQNDSNILFKALSKQLNVKYYLDTTVTPPLKLYSEPSGPAWKYNIITEDGMLFSTDAANKDDRLCKSKMETNKLKSINNSSDVCMYVKVDVDGIGKGPDKYCENSDDLNSLNCDKIYFYVTTEGITAGNSDCTIAGRIMSNNLIYDCNNCGTCGE